jgi:hypothetical protein
MAKSRTRSPALDYDEATCKSSGRIYVPSHQRKVMGGMTQVKATCKKLPKNAITAERQALLAASKAIRELSSADCLAQNHVYVSVTKGKLAGKQYCRLAGKKLTTRSRSKSRSRSRKSCSSRSHPRRGYTIRAGPAKGSRVKATCVRNRSKSRSKSRSRSRK